MRQPCVADLCRPRGGGLCTAGLKRSRPNGPAKMEPWGRAVNPAAAGYGSGSKGISCLKCQQISLDFETTAETGQRPIGTDDPVAGNHDGQRIRGVGTAHGAARGRLADARGQRAIGNRLREGDLAQGHTRFWKAVPAKRRGRSNRVNSPAK
jgi:hypothetical protein